MLLYRFVKAGAIDQAFSGLGEGRWKSEGTPIVECGRSRSLALLEVLANCDAADLRETHVLYEVEVPDECVQRLAEGVLPKDWRHYPYPESTQELGDAWAGSGSSLALMVPSSIVPQEQNVLLNPAHPDFLRVLVGSPEPCRMDQRLKQ